MNIPLSKNVDMIALGNWLEQHVGPIYARTQNNMLGRPANTPLSTGALWVIDSINDRKRLELTIDLRKLKPSLRTELILRFSA